MTNSVISYILMKNLEKWQGKYRIPSARASWWDYASDGAYFITICTQNRTHFFGECSDGTMKLSTMGAIAQGFWYEIPKHFPFVTLGEFVVMPNHIHGVLILERGNDGGPNDDIPNDGGPNDGIPNDVEIGQCPISTGSGSGSGSGSGLESPRQSTAAENLTPAQKRFRNQGKNTVSSIVGSYKSICTKHINLAFPEMKFGWQKLFWDNIIKDDTAFRNISNYIINNPSSWENDKFYLKDEQ